MSNINQAALAGLEFEDPRKIALVRLLADKTKEGKIPWVKQRNAVTSNLQGSLEVNFVTQASILGGLSWQLFTVRDSKGNELLRATPAPLRFFEKNFPLTVHPIDSPSLPQAVDRLFEAVSAFTGDDLDGAISTVKNL